MVFDIIAVAARAVVADGSEAGVDDDHLATGRGELAHECLGDAQWAERVHLVGVAHRIHCDRFEFVLCELREAAFLGGAGERAGIVYQDVDCHPSERRAGKHAHHSIFGHVDTLDDRHVADHLADLIDAAPRGCTLAHEGEDLVAACGERLDQVETDSRRRSGHYHRLLYARLGSRLKEAEALEVDEHERHHPAEKHRCEGCHQVNRERLRRSQRLGPRHGTRGDGEYDEHLKPEDEDEARGTGQCTRTSAVRRGRVVSGRVQNLLIYLRNGYPTFVKLFVYNPRRLHIPTGATAAQCAGVCPPVSALAQLPPPPTHPTATAHSVGSPISHMAQHLTSSLRVRAVAPRERHWPCSVLTPARPTPRQ